MIRSSMPHDEEQPGTVVLTGWQFRAFMLVIGAVLFSFIGWLGWSALKYSPTDETDVLKSLLASEIFVVPDILIASRPSDCRTQGVVRGTISASLFEAFQRANSRDAESVALYRYRPRQRYVDESKEPVQWYRELGQPVVSISRAGIDGDRALVCIDIYANREQSYLITMHHMGETAWAVENQTLIWAEERELPPEEIPESVIPEVR